MSPVMMASIKEIQGPLKGTLWPLRKVLRPAGKKKVKARVAGQPEQLFVNLGLEGWDDLDIRDSFRLGVRLGIAKVQAVGFDTNKRWADHTPQQQETAQDTLQAHLMEYFGLQAVLRGTCTKYLRENCRQKQKRKRTQEPSTPSPLGQPAFKRRSSNYDPVDSPEASLFDSRKFPQTLYDTPPYTPSQRVYNPVSISPQLGTDLMPHLTTPHDRHRGNTLPMSTSSSPMSKNNIYEGLKNNHIPIPPVMHMENGTLAPGFPSYQNPRLGPTNIIGDNFLFDLTLPQTTGTYNMLTPSPYSSSPNRTELYGSSFQPTQLPAPTVNSSQETAPGSYTVTNEQAHPTLAPAFELTVSSNKHINRCKEVYVAGTASENRAFLKNLCSGPPELTKLIIQLCQSQLYRSGNPST